MGGGRKVGHFRGGGGDGVGDALRIPFAPINIPSYLSSSFEGCALLIPFPPSPENGVFQLQTYGM